MGQLSSGLEVCWGWRGLRAVREPPLHPYRGHPHRDARFPSSRERRGDRPYIRTGGIHTGMRGSRLHGNDGRPPLHPHRGPPFTGTTGAQPPFTLILTFSPQGRRDLSAPYTPNRVLTEAEPASREKGPDILHNWGGTLTLTLSQRERGFPRLRGNDGARLSVGRFSC